MDSKRVRISIANLAWYATTVENNIRYPIAILNPNKLKKGERQYMALGGGAMLTERGKKRIEETFGASDFEFDEKTGFFDARFQIDDQHLEEVFCLFGDSERFTWYEQDRTIDIMNELTGNEPGHEGIMSESDRCLIDCVYVKSVRQKPSEFDADTSTRVTADIPTRRLFRIFELRMSQSLYNRKFVCSPFVRVLHDHELVTTDGGSKSGRTNDGYVIQNNLFLA